MAKPQNLLRAVEKLNLPNADWEEVRRRLTKPEPNAADFTAVRMIIRNFTLDRVPTTLSEADAENYFQAEEAAAKMAIASLRAITEDIDTLVTATRDI